MGQSLIGNQRSEYGDIKGSQNKAERSEAVISPQSKIGRSMTYPGQ